MNADLWTIRAALEMLPEVCRYHGEDFDRSGHDGPNGEPRCDSCKPAWRRMCALAAVKRLSAPLNVERSDDGDYREQVQRGVDESG